MNRTITITIAILVVIISLILAGIYFTHPANQLPAYLPGHDATSSKLHAKHGLAAIILALGAGIVAWFQTGSKPSAEKSPTSAD